MKTDFEISKEAHILPIEEIAKKLGVDMNYVEAYGKYKAKIDPKAIKEKKDSKLILVTAITPTPAGEGKSTVTIGLTDGLNRIGKFTVAALREPSLGPVFGIKGGACGGGYAQVIPMEDINLHFTGDLHAITTANNLLMALIDNHIEKGNELRIDEREVKVRRVMDINDRALRNIVVGLGGRNMGYPREDHFMITVASEVMAALCLANSLMDLKERLENIVFADNMDKEPLYVRDLGAEGAMAVVLKDAIKPNLVQTLENNPAIIHGGPFANIAHGCNSVLATKMALSIGDYVVTEAGFGSDLGAEKFMDIKMRLSGLKPDLTVVVVTIRALKMHGGVEKDHLSEENLDALKVGFANAKRHIENMQKFGVPVTVAINVFKDDTEKEIALLKEMVREVGVEATECRGFEKGSEGTKDLAKVVVETIDNNKSDFKPIYPLELSIEEKIEKIAKEIYRAKGVNFTAEAKRKLKYMKEHGFSNLPVCIAKTQYSFSDNPKALNAPEDFEITVRDLNLSNGAGFVVALTGDIMTMPGLAKVPAALKMDIDSDGNIVGLF